MNLTRDVLVLAVSSALAVGCGSAESAPVEQHPATSQQSDLDPPGFEHGVRGTLLESIVLSEDHRIDFFELTSGGTLMREEYSLDIPTEARLSELKDLDGMASVFRALRPNEVVPVALLEADARDALRRRSETENGLYASVETDEDADVEDAPIFTPAQALPPCSADEYGDGWGGQWFLDNYCGSGPGAYKWCWANGGSYVTGGFDVPHTLVWTQFEGDFNRSGSFMLEHRSCGLFSCNWEVDIWDPVPPRKVRAWSSSHSKQRINALSSCSHMGVVFKW
jgi:hypothetical protein